MIAESVKTYMIMFDNKRPFWMYKCKNCGWYDSEKQQCQFYFNFIKPNGYCPDYTSLRKYGKQF